MDYGEVARFSVNTAEQAGKLVLKILDSSGLGTKAKNEYGNLVTIADTESERFIREQIKKCFSGHNILGEEQEDKITKSDFTWVIDPVDGTTVMACGLDGFGISIGLWKDKNPVVGVMYFPKLNIIVESVEGAGTFINSRQVFLANKFFSPDVSGFIVSAFDLSGSGNHKIEIEKYFLPLATTPGIKYPFIFRSSTYSTLLLLKGKVDVYIHPGPTIYDIGAALLAVKSAGGDYRFLDSEKNEPDFSHSKQKPVILASNTEILNRIAGIYQ